MVLEEKGCEGRKLENKEIIGRVVVGICVLVLGEVEWVGIRGSKGNRRWGGLKRREEGRFRGMFKVFLGSYD